jgi:hypothetical protein
MRYILAGLRWLFVEFVSQLLFLLAFVIVLAGIGFLAFKYTH